MPQTKFKICEWRKTPINTAAEHGALRPLFQVCESRNRYGSLYKLISWRRNRLRQLHVSGWARIASEQKLGWAYNCPPCCASVTPKSQPCHLPICPFCHGRRLGEAYKAMEAAGRGLQGVKAIGFRSVWSKATGEGIGRIFLGDDVLEPGLAAMVDKIRWTRQHLYRGWLKGIQYGYRMQTIEPIMFRRTAQDDAVGCWRVTQSLIAFVPADWKAYPKQGELYEAEPGGADLAELVGMVFEYPREWMCGPAGITAVMLNHLKHRHVFDRFGSKWK